MPTVKEKGAVEERLLALRSETFRTQGGMMRPSESPGGLTWDDLSREQAMDVLSCSVDWSGFSAEQQVEVSLRAVDDDWDHPLMEGIVASNQREHDRADALERRTEEWFGQYGRLPQPGEMERHDAEVREAWRKMPLDKIVDEPWQNESIVAESGESFDRLELLLATHSLAREIGFVGYRAEFMSDPHVVEEWPDPADREQGLRDTWNETLDFRSYEQAHADADIASLSRLHGNLLALRDGPEEAQLDYYRRISALGREEREGREAANDNVPGGDGNPPGGPSLSAYDRRLQAAAEQSKYHTMNQEKDNGRDR